MAPNAMGRLIRELLNAARSREMPLAVRLRPGYLHQENFSVKPFVQKLELRPSTGRMRLFCQPVFALPETKTAFSWSLSAVNHLEILPGELGRLKHFEKIWVPSKLHSEILENSGVPIAKIFVFAPGVDHRLFHPRVAPSKLVEPSSNFTFLFLGNPTWRKGLDIVLRAYLEEFSAKEPVRLVVKLTHLPKKKKNFSWEISDLVNRLGAINSMFPPVRVLSETVFDEEIPRILRSANVLVTASRSFQFSMSVREAMVTGIPVIGPIGLEKILGLTEENGYPVVVEKKVLPAGKMYSNSPDCTIEEMDVSDLRRRMREAFKNHRGAREKGKQARQDLKRTSDWMSVIDSILLEAGVEVKRSAGRSSPERRRGPSRFSREGSGRPKNQKL